MRDETNYDLFAYYTNRQVVRNVWPLSGGSVDKAIERIMEEGFHKKKARKWLKCLTVLQLKRMKFRVGPFYHRLPDIPEPITEEPRGY